MTKEENVVVEEVQTIEELEELEPEEKFGDITEDMEVEDGI